MKPGATTWPAAVDGSLGSGALQIPNADDAIAFNGQVGSKSRPSRSVDYATVPDDQIVVRSLA